MDKKNEERAYLELAHKIDPGFPPGPFTDSEEPDFLLPRPSGTLGIEVRRIRQGEGSASISASEVEGYRAKVIRTAEQRYTARGGPPVDVVISFPSSDGRRSLSPMKLADAIALFVVANPPDKGQVTLFQWNTPNVQLPEGVYSINIAFPLATPHRPWWGGGVGETLPLTRDILARAIASKEENVARYRKKAFEVFLLLVVNTFPSSASFAVPDEIAVWEFDFTFDKVVVVSGEEGKVWTLRRSPSSVTGPHCYGARVLRFLQGFIAKARQH